MIASFKIQNYRQFADLKVDGLKRVNLIVGDNGAGKSSLLEALWLYVSSSNRLDVALDILSARGEIFRRGIHIEYPDEMYRSPFATLFRSPLDGCEDIYGAFFKAAYESHYELILIEFHLDEFRTGRIEFLADREGDTLERVGFGHDDFDFSARQFSCKRGDNVFIPAIGLDQKGTADFWERISLTDIEDDVEDALRTFVPDLLRLSLIAGRPVARLKGATAPVPLRRLGEGVNRAFALMAAMANARNGVLLIDEIEIGLYRTTLAKLWPYVFEAAKRLNVQVFATTHSWDCIAGFSAAAKATSEDDGALVRLEARDGKVVAVTYDEQQLAIATEHGIEVR